MRPLSASTGSGTGYPSSTIRRYQTLSQSPTRSPTEGSAWPTPAGFWNHTAATQSARNATTLDSA